MGSMTNVSRRSIFKIVGGIGAGLALGCVPLRAAERSDKKGVVFAPNEYITVGPDGIVTVTITRSDMGQGIRTTIAMIVAEELDADWNHVRVTQAGAGSKRVNGGGTGGSSSTPGLYNNLRKIAAGSRQMLVEAAAKQWGVDPSTCHTAAGKVFNASGKAISYGELTAAASLMTPPADAKPKPRSEFKIIGKSKSRVDNLDVVTGRAIYGQDVHVDGMVFAVVSRRPAIGATLKSFDATATKKVSGVIDAIQIASGVAVIATNTYAATQGRDALKVEWDNGPNAELDSKQVSSKMRAALGEHTEMPAGAKVVEASYEFPFLAHATLEPMNAVADVKDGSCTVWTGSQAPTGAQQQVARQLGIEASNVTINVPLLGGGFGRRFMHDWVSEVVEISKAVKKPVKLLYTRDDDLRTDFYRPAGIRSFKGAISSSGEIVGWSGLAADSAGGRGGKGRVGKPAIPYDIPSATNQQAGAGIAVPTGAWRSVENSTNNPAYECFVDELAHAAGKDPVAFRQALISDPRLKHVLATVAEKAGWGKALPAGHGMGVAVFKGYGSYAAHVAEVSVKGDAIKVVRVVCAVDPGIAVNPRGVEAQIQGAIIDGVATALKVSITLEKGLAAETSYFDYNWARIGDAPKTEVHIVESGDNSPGGMGEVGYPSVIPAIANAIAAVTGKRARKFPIKVSELV